MKYSKTFRVTSSWEETGVMLEQPKPKVEPSNTKLSTCRLCGMGFMCAMLTFALCATAIGVAAFVVYTLADEEIETNSDKLEGDITKLNKTLQLEMSALKADLLAQNTKYDQLQKGNVVLKRRMKETSAQYKHTQSNKPQVSKSTTTKAAAIKTTTTPTTENTTPDDTDYNY